MWYYAFCSQQYLLFPFYYRLVIQIYENFPALILLDSVYWLLLYSYFTLFLIFLFCFVISSDLNNRIFKHFYYTCSNKVMKYRCSFLQENISEKYQLCHSHPEQAPLLPRKPGFFCAAFTHNVWNLLYFTPWVLAEKE